jgi:hypothetical protein
MKQKDSGKKVTAGKKRAARRRPLLANGSSRGWSRLWHGLAARIIGFG